MYSVSSSCWDLSCTVPQVCAGTRDIQCLEKLLVQWMCRVPSSCWDQRCTVYKVVAGKLVCSKSSSCWNQRCTGFQIVAGIRNVRCVKILLGQMKYNVSRSCRDK